MHKSAEADNRSRLLVRNNSFISDITQKAGCACFGRKENASSRTYSIIKSIQQHLCRLRMRSSSANPITYLTHFRLEQSGKNASVVKLVYENCHSSDFHNCWRRSPDSYRRWKLIAYFMYNYLHLLIICRNRRTRYFAHAQCNAAACLWRQIDVARKDVQNRLPLATFVFLQQENIHRRLFRYKLPKCPKSVLKTAFYVDVNVFCIHFFFFFFFGVFEY